MLSEKQMEAIRGVYSRPKSKSKKSLKTRVQGGCGCADFYTKEKPPAGCATRLPFGLN